MQTITDILEERFNSNLEKIKVLKTEMFIDYEHAFSWGRPANLYKLIVTNDFLAHVIEDVKYYKDSNERIETLQRIVDYYTKEILNGEFTQSSSNIYSNDAYAIKKEVKVQLIKYFNIILKRFK